MDVVASTRVTQANDTPGQVTFPKAYALVNGSSLLGKVIKLRIHAYVPNQRTTTEVIRDIEIRLESELASSPTHWLQIGDDGIPWWRFDSGFQNDTGSRTASGQIAVDGGSIYKLEGESGQLTQAGKFPVTTANGYDGKPLTLSLTSNVATVGGNYSYPFILLTEPTVTALTITPQSGRVGDVLAIVVEGDRLPIQVPLVVPNCGPLVEQRAAGNLARGNFNTSQREFRCTATTVGTGLVASIGTLKQTTFNVLPAAIVPPPGQVFRDDFSGIRLSASNWNEVTGFGGISMVGGELTFGRAASANTQNKVTVSGSKLVIEARLAGKGVGRDTNVALVDADDGSLIISGDTNYRGWGLYAFGTGKFNFTGTPNSGGTTVAFNGATTSAYTVIRVTIQDRDILVERGPSLDSLTTQLQRTLGASTLGRRFHLQIGTGGGIEYSPGTFDWVQVSAPTVTVASPQWDLVSDFSTTASSSGPWKYSFDTAAQPAQLMGTATTNCSLIPFPCWKVSSTAVDLPMISVNNSGATVTHRTLVVPNGMVLMHPGFTASDVAGGATLGAGQTAGQRPVISWTAPADGTYVVAGRFQIADVIPTGVRVIIKRDATVIVDQSLTGNGPILPFSFSSTFLQGQSVSFTVDAAGSAYNDSTVLAATVTKQ